MRNDISNADDVIDTRDVIARVKELRKSVNERDPKDPDAAYDDERSELTMLEDLLEQMRGNGGDEQWNGAWYPGSLVRDSYFTEYAQELAEDIGAVDREASWPNQYIDWYEAADALKQDYTSVEFGGVTYWVR